MNRFGVLDSPAALHVIIAEWVVWVNERSRFDVDSARPPISIERRSNRSTVACLGADRKNIVDKRHDGINKTVRFFFSRNLPTDQNVLGYLDV